MGKNNNANTPCISDGEIIELYWLRDEAAIKRTDEKYGGFLYAMALNILHEHRDCEECRNDTYLSAWNAIPPAKPMFFRAFISQIMRRTAINRYYQNTGKRKIPSELTVSMDECGEFIAEEKSSDEEIDARELGRLISDFVRGLPAKRQYIFMGRFYFADSVTVIADELKVSKSAVYKEIKKLRKELRIFLEQKEVYV